MPELSLLEDLIKNFQEEKQSLEKEIALVDPLAAAVRKPVAAHFFQNGFLVVLSFLTWILILGCIALILLMDEVYPFDYLSRIVHDTDIMQRYQQHDLAILEWSIKGLIALLALILICVARMLGRIRRKNNVLHLAGKNLKLLMEQYFKRKGNIAHLENKYPVDLPENADGIAAPPPPRLNGDEDILL